MSDPPETIVELASDPRDGRVEASVRLDGKSLGAYLEVKGDVDVTPYAGDVLFAAAMIPALASGGTLRIEAPVSPRLLASLSAIQSLYRSWVPRFGPISVDAPARPSGRAEDGRAFFGHGLFFSSGVDSFYSLKKSLEVPSGNVLGPVTHLVFLSGFDTSLPPDHSARIKSNIESVAEATGTSVIEIETNMRDLVAPFMRWQLGLGSVMGAAALSLQPVVDRFTIASSHWYAALEPWGSHPLLDPLWSTDELQIAQHGLDRARFEKVADVAAWDVARTRLRVCWDETSEGLNCGRCSKCLRTMLTLEAHDLLADVATLPDDFTATRLIRNYNPQPYEKEHLREIASTFHSRGRPDLVWGIRGARGRMAIHRALRATRGGARRLRHLRRS